MNSLWKQVRYRLEYLGCHLLAGLIPRLPRRACLALARALGDLFFRFDSRTRAVALENLRLTLGDTHDVSQREQIARESLRNFARAMLDLFWARNLTSENYAKFIKVEGFEPAIEAHARGKGVILLSLHAGSHEWVALTPGFIGLPSLMVALDFKNPALDGVFNRAREVSGHRIIGQKQSMLRLLRTVKRGGVTGLLVDLGVRLNQPGMVIDVFGMKMHVTVLHAILHARTGALILPVTNIPHPDGTCTVTGHAPLTFPTDTPLRDVIQACWNVFEPTIHARPELWLWNYKHWRYQPLNPGREYPFYSHPSTKFDRLLTATQAAEAPQPDIEKTG